MNVSAMIPTLAAGATVTAESASEGSNPGGNTTETGKERVYVDVPSEVPEGAAVEEGERGGYYYDSSEAEEFEQAMEVAAANMMEEYDWDDAVLEQAQQERQKYQEDADQVFQQLVENTPAQGGQYRVKRAPSILEKTERKDKSIDDIDDMFGAMLFPDSTEDVEDTVQMIQDEFDVAEVDNRMDNDGYYRAVHVDINIDDERTGEVQIKTDQMADIIEVGHKTVYKDETELDIDDDDRDAVSECLEQQMDALMGEIDSPDCSDRAVEIIQEVRS